MRALADSLAARRTALVARSGRQRAELTAAATRLEHAATEPLVIGLGAAVALAGASPRARTWLVRAWVAGALLRRLLGR